MKNYVKMFDSIKNTSSRLEKEKLLKEYKDDEGFLQILKFVYNPLITTGLAKKKMNKNISYSNAIELKDIFETIQYVTDNNTGTDLIIATVQKFINTLDTEDEKSLAKSILIKDMPIGLSTSTLNKVYGEDFINKFAVQLAGRYNPDKNTFRNGFTITLKLDGNRCIVMTTPTGPKFYARSGIQYSGLFELEKAFADLPIGLVFDGEIIAKNPNNLSRADLFNLTQSILRTKGQKGGLEFYCFDMLPISEFNKGKSTKIYSDRMLDLNDIFYNIDSESLIKRVRTFYIGDDVSVIQDFLTYVIDQGYEGLILNDNSSLYECKRHKGILKVKMFYTIDLRCTGVKEDVRGGKCGSLICDYKGFRVDVAGLKEKNKINFWQHPEKVVGKVIEVKYFEESTNQSDNDLSLRFPNFIRITDKNEVSYD